MLDWIIGGKADHPMADLRKARELIAELPSGNSLRALEEITGWLDSLNEAQELKLKSRLDAVDLLDRAAKNHQFKLAPEYLEAPRLQKLYKAASGIRHSDSGKPWARAICNASRRIREAHPAPMRSARICRWSRVAPCARSPSS